MKTDSSNSPKPQREFGGCVELIPASPNYTEFIDSHRIWGFPTNHLTHFLFRENSHWNGQNNLPPDQLFLVYHPATICLKGWRLELLIDPLVKGRVARVHAEKHLGALIVEEAWVSEIHVLLHDDTILDQEKLDRWISHQP